MPRPDLRALPPVFRALAVGFLISLGLAYAIALLFVFVETDMTSKGITSQYRGGAGDGIGEDVSVFSAEGEENPPRLREEWASRNQGLKFPKPLKEMILTTHLHMLSISTILLLVGAIFACSSFPERGKTWIIAAGFLGLVLDFSCMWGVRYIGHGFSLGVFFFGSIQSLSLALQMLVALVDLLRPGIGTRLGNP